MAKYGLTFAPLFPFDYSLFPYTTPVNGGRVRPIRPGYSISGPLKTNSDGTAIDYTGTIAGFFRDEDGDVVALSTISSFGDHRNCQPGDLIYQPSLYDNTNYGLKKDTTFIGWPDANQADASTYPYFATLKKFVPLRQLGNYEQVTSNKSANKVSVCGLATAKVHPSFLSNKLIDPTYLKPAGEYFQNLTMATINQQIDYIKEDATLYDSANLGYLPVQKFGRTTGYTTGYYNFDNKGDIDALIHLDPKAVGTEDYKDAKNFHAQRFTITPDSWVIWPESPVRIQGTQTATERWMIASNAPDLSIAGWFIIDTLPLSGPRLVTTVRSDGTWKFYQSGYTIDGPLSSYQLYAVHPTLGNRNVTPQTLTSNEKFINSYYAGTRIKTGWTPFALPGDAGSMVFDMQMRPISIIIGGIPSVIPPNTASQYFIQWDISGNPTLGTITAGDHSDLNIITLGVSVERAIKIFKLKPFTL